MHAIIPDYNDVEFLSPYLFRSQILNLLEEQPDLTKVDYSSEIIEKGYGTVYALFDKNNLKLYDLKGLNTYLFTPEQSAGRNCVVVALRELPEEYKKVVFLDAPLSYPKTNAEYFVVNNVNGFNYIDNLDVSRETFGQIYKTLTSYCGKTFYNSATFAISNNLPFDVFTTILATEVFLELGFFSIEKNILVQNQGVKNTLTNSIIYSKILNIKGV